MNPIRKNLSLNLDTLNDNGKPCKHIGIAWNSDTNSEFYRNMIAAVENMGYEYILLDQVKSEEFNYINNKLDKIYIDENDFLKSEYAEKIKRDTYKNSNVEKVMKNCLGVIFTGGHDISPTLQKNPEQWHNIIEEKDYDSTRDVSDFLLMSYCIDKDIPAIGFCRGSQMMAIVSGASIIQDIPTYLNSKGIENDYLHRIDKIQVYKDYSPHNITIVDKKSRIYSIANTDSITNVPSWHHQAIGNVSNTKIKVTATTDTHGVQIVEGIERTDKSYIIGYQFHPEASIKKSINKDKNADKFMDLKLAYGIIEDFYKFAISHN